MPEALFNPIPDKVITAYDLFDKKHKRNLRNFKFRVSVYGLLFRGDKLLLQRHPDLKSFGLPGGGIEIGEGIEDSLRREFKEETGLIVEMGDLVAVTEDFFTYEGEDAHSILIIYKVKVVGGELLPMGNQDDTGEVKYIDIGKLTKHNTQRVFWKIIKTLKKNGRS